MSDDRLRADGWRPLEGATDFNLLAGPYWVRPDGAGFEVGFASRAEHSNGPLGLVHGGALMTLADVALGCLVGSELGGPNCATVQLNYAFAAAARLGDFVSCRPELLRRTSALLFVRGVVRAGGRTVGSAEGIWRVLGEEKIVAMRG